jgi:hypothetical protein
VPSATAEAEIRILVRVISSYPLFVGIPIDLKTVASFILHARRPAEAAAEAEAAVADKRPSPGSPTRPDTFASQAEAAEVAAEVAVEAVEPHHPRQA